MLRQLNNARDTALLLFSLLVSDWNVRPKWAQTKMTIKVVSRRLPIPEMFLHSIRSSQWAANPSLSSLAVYVLLNVWQATSASLQPQDRQNRQWVSLSEIKWIPIKWRFNQATILGRPENRLEVSDSTNNQCCFFFYGQWWHSLSEVNTKQEEEEFKIFSTV